MVIKNFDELVKKVWSFETRRKVAVVAAEDTHTLDAVFKSREDNILDPILIGSKDRIKNILDEKNYSLEDEFIIDVEDEVVAANKGVELIKMNRADFIMKGKIQTSDLLKAVVHKEKGIRTEKLMSHFGIFEVPTYHKLLVITDGGMVINPDIYEKKQIIENAVDVLTALGYANPKIGILSAVEKVNPKMPETVDADELKKMNEKGEIKGCIIEGPISYDLALDKKSAQVKGYNSPVAGDADLLILPNITAGNILAKSLMYSGNSKMAGLIVGAQVPIVLTSRGATMEEKYLSLVLSAASV